MNYQKKVEAIPTKGITKDLINKSKVLNSAIYFSSGILQNYLISLSTNKYIEFLFMKI